MKLKLIAGGGERGKQRWQVRWWRW